MKADLRARLDALPPEEILEVMGVLFGRVLLECVRSGSAGNGQPDTNVNATEAARRLGVSRDWIYRNADRLPFKVGIGRRVLFSARGLELWNRQRQGR